jgi:hypothetical protein
MIYCCVRDRSAFDFFWRFSGDLSPILPTSYHNGVAWCLVRGRFFLSALPREMYDYDIAHVLTSPMFDRSRILTRSPLFQLTTKMAGGSNLNLLLY